MNKLSLIYPEAGLSISISLRNRDTLVEDFSDTITSTTQVYKYDFVGAVGVDYEYVASCVGYDNMVGVIYADTASGGGATAQEVWEYATKPLIVNLGDISKIL